MIANCLGVSGPAGDEDDPEDVELTHRDVFSPIDGAADTVKLPLRDDELATIAANLAPYFD